MKKLIGIPASPGIAIGPAFLIQNQDATPFAEKKKIPATNVAWEVRRFTEAVLKTEQDINFSQTQVKNVFGKNYVKLLQAHKLILKDPALTTGVIKKIQTEHITSESALYASLKEITENFENIKNDFFRERRFDINDVVKRIFENLTQNKNDDFTEILTPSILIAHNLYPSDTINLKENKVLAFAIDLGGKTSHTAILAQSMQMPAVVGLKDAAAQIEEGQTIIIDGDAGIIIIDPDEKTLTIYKKKRDLLVKKEKSLEELNLLPNITKDGHKVSLYLNFDPRRDIETSNTIRSEGVGLLRTEFIYMDRVTPPSEKEQIEIYTKAASSFPNRPFTIRLADLGGDKVEKLGLARAQEEDNPFMGCRGIRLFLKYPLLMRVQMHAIIKTAAQSQAKIKMMVPMISSLEEVLKVKKMFEDSLLEMDILGIKPNNKIDFGVMIEVPSAAFTVDTILPYVDFISIGTNDLIQYLIAVDRVNTEVASLYDPYHPAVLRTLNFVIQACRKKGKPVSICGEMASSPDAIPFLVGLGVDILSISPAMFLRIKNTLRNLSFAEASNLAQAAILMSSSTEIRQLKEDYKTNEEDS